MQKVLAVVALVVVVVLAGIEAHTPDASTPDPWAECVRRWQELTARQCTPATCAKVHDDNCDRCTAANARLMRLTCKAPHEGPVPPRVLER